ncbi:MAG: TIGR02996 domain-containing protein, partial [Planctomycetales bacterium]
MHKRFVHEILSNLSDPVPRLVYADWLEERGDDQRAAIFRDENFVVSSLYTLVVENYGDGDGHGGSSRGEGCGWVHRYGEMDG